MSDADTTSVDRIDDEEVVYRRVPQEPPFHKPDNWLTTANFDLDSRQNELGVSVYRRILRSADDVMRDRPGCFLVSATVGEIRTLKNGKGEPLHLDVVADIDSNNPGHAEIQSPTAGHLSRAARKALRDLFAKSRIGD